MREERRAEGAPERPEKKATRRGLGRVYARVHTVGHAPVFWVEFWHRGICHRESSKSTREADAVRLLKARLGEIGAGTFAGPQPERVTFGDLAVMLVNDYQVHGRKTLDSLKRAIAHLRQFFGASRAMDITRDKVDGYIAARLKDKAAAGTIQKELSAIKRGFALAVQAGRLSVRPHFTRLKVENTRTASLTEAQLGAVLDVLAHGRPATALEPVVQAQPDLVPPILFAAMTGWRLTSDVLSLTWQQIDFAAGTVTRWSRGTTKAERHVVFPFEALPALAALLQQQREATDAVQRQRACIIEHVFHRRGGQPIRSLYGAWRAASRRAGVPGRVPHDLRRMASRTLRGLGMSDRDIAELVGWETQAMVSRYLGRDPAGVAERLRRNVAESEARTRTKPARIATAQGGQDDGQSA